MNKQVITVCLLALTGTSFAQSKIKDGTVTGSSSLPNSSAVLEVESASRGFLQPRVALQGTTMAAPLTAHIAGMHVYNTATAANVTPGEYYNNGSQWVRLVDADSTPFYIQGTTNDALGNKTSVIKRSGGMSLGNNSYAIGTGTGTTTSFACGNLDSAKGYNTVAMGDHNIANGFFSIAMGGSNFSSGTASVAMGAYDTASGFRSVALGSNCDATGTASVAMGANTTASGDYSTAMGASTIASGFQSVAIGAYASAIGQGSMVMGDYLTVSGTNSFGIKLYNSVAGSLDTLSQDNTFAIMGGNVGIGTLTPGNPLQMGSGAFCSTAGVWVNASDARLKTNIKPTPYGLTEVLKLRPVNYNMKADGEKQVGFIAQELKQIVPEVVYGKEGDLTKGETLGVSYGNLVPVLTKAIQELQDEINVLKAELTALKKNR